MGRRNRNRSQATSPGMQASADAPPEQPAADELDDGTDDVTAAGEDDAEAAGDEQPAEESHAHGRTVRGMTGKNHTKLHTNVHVVLHNA